MGTFSISGFYIIKYNFWSDLHRISTGNCGEPYGNISSETNTDCTVLVYKKIPENQIKQGVGVHLFTDEKLWGVTIIGKW